MTVITVYAPDSCKDLEEYEKFIKEATEVSQEGRRARAGDFNIAGDLNMELGVRRTSDEEDQELREMYGSRVGKGVTPTRAG